VPGQKYSGSSSRVPLRSVDRLNVPGELP
jgi:hypothetical protein